jgi:hypothetical protein
MGSDRRKRDHTTGVCWGKLTISTQTLLVAMVEDGKIKPATTAMDIYEEDEEFRKYDKDVFRSAFQRVKNKKGVYLRNGK